MFEHVREEAGIFFFCCKDRHGREHEYSLTPLPSRQASRISIVIAEIVGGALGTLVKTLETSSKAAHASGATGLSVDSLDLSDLPSAIEALPRKLAERGGEALLWELLSKAKRNASIADSGEPDKWEALSDGNTFDRVYAGNLWEMFAAVAVSLWVNFAPFGLDTTSVWDKLLTMLGGFTQTTQGTSPTTSAGASV